jgi:hypothetical protein
VLKRILAYIRVTPLFVRHFPKNVILAGDPLLLLY